MKATKVLLLLLIAIVVWIFFYFDLASYLTLDAIKTHQNALNAYYQHQPVLLITIYFFIYVISVAVSLPGATILTIAAGLLFGNLGGVVIVSFASTIGATLAFVASRYLLRHWVESRFGQRLEAINQGIKSEGAFYLFTLRLVPLFPFFMINLLMGLTRMRAITFFWVSQIGMLPGTLVYVNAGTQLAKLDAIQGILSPTLIGSFILIGVFPLIAKRIVEALKTHQVYQPYQKPKRFEHNLVVIGAGSGGLVSAYIAAALKAKVTLVEKNKMGGDCLNTGCVPSKALIRSARLAYEVAHADRFGLKVPSAEIDFAAIMARIQNVINDIAPHDSVERYRKLGVNVISGEARITSPWQVEVNGETLTTRNIVIATGAKPFVPDISGLEDIEYLTSDNLWQLTEQPKRLLILGGGPIGCELSQAFARLGSQVSLIQRGDRILPREDSEFSEMVTHAFQRDGIHLYLNHEAKAVTIEDGEQYLICGYQGEDVKIPFDQILIALGRTANISGFGIEDLQIPQRENGTIETNAFLQTNYPNIYAVGDVTGPYQFTHTASHQAWYAAVNALFGRFKRFKVDYSVIPWATFTDPEIARVGINEMEAQKRGIAVEITTYGLEDLDRAIADGSAYGMVKVLTAPGKDRILGVTIAGEHASDLIAEFVTAMRYGLGLNKLLATIHIYPTMTEANKYAAGNWKRAHTPPFALRLLKQFHQWMRHE